MELLSFNCVDVIFFAIWILGASSKDVIKDPEDSPSEYPYCFRFTWLGEKFDGESEIKNLTCETFRKDLKNVPCRRPLVATTNSKQPDTKGLWVKYQKKNKNEIGCRLVKGESCVKYSYIFNKAVENITYMCAKVNASNGCYTHKYSTGREVEVCVCESTVGDMPCNYGSTLHKSLVALIVSIIYASVYLVLRI